MRLPPSCAHAIVVTDYVLAFVVGRCEFVPFDEVVRAVLAGDYKIVGLRFHGSANAVGELPANVRSGPVTGCTDRVESVVTEPVLLA